MPVPVTLKSLESGRVSQAFEELCIQEGDLTLCSLFVK